LHAELVGDTRARLAVATARLHAALDGQQPKPIELAREELVRITAQLTRG
jgi:hypothetical protein